MTRLACSTTALSALLLLVACDALTLPFAKEFKNEVDPIVVQEHLDALGPPVAPKGVHTVAGDGKVTLTWDATENATGYKVYYALGTTAGASDSQLAASMVIDTSATVEGLDSGSQYAFAVAAVNGKGAGPLSSVALATVPYTISLDSQSADVPATTSTVLVTPGSTLSDLPSDLSRVTYYFDGWYTGTNGGGTLFTTSTPVTTNLTIYAKWSPSGENFIKQTYSFPDAPGKGHWRLAFGNGVFVAVSTSDPVAYWSTDGQTWTTATGLNQLPAGGTVTAVFSGGKFIVLPTVAGATGAAWSSDGKSWAASTLPTHTGGTWSDHPATDGSRLAAVTTNSATSMIVYTDNGIDWNTGSIVQGSWDSMVYSGGLWALVENSNGSSRVARSTNGVSWSVPSSSHLPVVGGTIRLTAVTAMNGIFSVADFEGTTYWSNDVINWYLSTSGLGGYTSWWMGVATEGNGVLLLINGDCGNSATLAKSLDGKTFSRPIPSADCPNDWVSMAYGNGLFVASGGPSDYSVTGTNQGGPNLPNQLWISR